jgi:hypothetical protein
MQVVSRTRHTRHREGPRQRQIANNLCPIVHQASLRAEQADNATTVATTALPSLLLVGTQPYQSSHKLHSTL